MFTIMISIFKKAYNHSSALIARLAVDKKYKHRKIGSWLLIDALKRILNVTFLWLWLMQKMVL